MTSTNTLLSIVEDEDIFGRISSKDEAVREFQPWHRPRKQWVRSCQWANSLSDLIDGSAYSSIEVIEYFGFPGSDCLDIQVLGQRLNSKNKKLCFYGLESQAIASSRAQSVVESILHDSPFISPSSKIEPSSRFEVIRLPDSKISAEIKERNPFNIVNLDFVNSIYSATRGRDTMEAILKLLDYQFSRQYKPWLLFITFRCDEQAGCKEILEEYAQVLSENINDHEGFRREVNKNVFCCDLDKLWSANELASRGESFGKVLILSFLKWILKNSISRSIVMKLKSSALYKVGDESHDPNMVSLVIEFNKIDGTSDVTNIVGPSLALIDEPMAAIKILKKQLRAKNVDDILSEDPSLNIRLTSEIKQILQKIGYDVSAYPF